VIQAMPEGLTEEVMDGWMQNGRAMKKLLASLVPARQTARPVVGGLCIRTDVTIVETPELSATPTNECLTGSIWGYRNLLFDTLLSKHQKATKTGTAAALATTREWRLIKAARAILGVTTNDVKKLGNLLIKGGYTLTLKQVQDLVERTEAGEATGLKTDGYANFFFVETGNEDEPVLVGIVDHRHVRDVICWDANIDHLDGGRYWSVERRLLLGNMDALRL
jgi:hypothetical protein